MLSFLLRPYLFLSLLLLPVIAGADSASRPFLLQADSSGATLNAEVDYFVDTGGRRGVADIAAADFVPTAGRTGLGLTPHPLWLRLRLQRAADAPARWWLEFSPLHVGEVVFYQPDTRGGYQMQQAGERHPFSQRPLAYRQYVYAVDVPADQPVTVYWRIQSDNTRLVPLRAWQLDHWSERSLREYALFGLCFGIMLGLAGYNLLLWLRLKNGLFLLYFFVISSYAVFAADLNGFAGHLFWPDGIWQWEGRSQALTNLYGVFFVLFIVRLLDTPTLTRWFVRVMYLAAALNGVSVLAALVGEPGVAGFLQQYVPLLWLPCTIVVALYRSWKGSAPAVYFLIGYGPLLAGIITLLGIGDGSIVANSFTESLYILAGAWEAIFFSQALAEHVNVLKRERAAALEHLRASEEKLASSEAKATLSTLMASVSHELNTPIGNSVMTASTLADSRREFQRAVDTGALSRSDLAAFVASVDSGTALLLRNLQRAEELLTNFRQVAADQASEQRREFDLANVMQEIIFTLKPSLKRHPHRVVVDIRPGIVMDSQPGPLGQIVINLINNAYLHAFEGRTDGVVTIAGELIGDQVHLSIADNGAGISEENLARMFEPFFSTKIGKGGTGLGMAIVENLVTKTLGGSIAVDTKLGRGTRFDIRLPRVLPGRQ